MTKRNYIIPIFIPHMGCKNNCVFCNQRFITKNLNPMTLEDVDLNIRTNLDFLKDKNNIEVAFYGGSFTGINKKDMINYLELVNEYINKNLINSIRLSTRADYIDGEILNTLKKYKVKTIELGVQSMLQDVLDKNMRGQKIEDVLNSSILIKNYGFKLGLQMMTGMYYSNKEKDLYTAEAIAMLKPDFVRIYPTLVLPETYLKKLYDQGLYRVMNLYECIDSLNQIVKVFESRNIPIARIGLPYEINENDNLIGPRHPSLRELVYSNIYLEIIEKYLDDFSNVKDIKIYASNKNLSYIVGYRCQNKKINKRI